MSQFFGENSRSHQTQDNIEQLCQQQLIFNAFFANAKIGMVIFDTQLRYVQINEALAEINGIPVADHIGKPLGEVLPQIALTLEPVLQRILETGEGIFDHEITGETPKEPGVIRSWSDSYYPLFAPDHSILGIGGIVIEISQQQAALREREKAEKTLRESEECYRCLIKATSQMVWKTDAEGHILDTGDWGIYTGQSLAEMVNMGWTEAIHPEDRETTAQAWMQALETKSLYETEFRLRAAHGSYRYFVARGVPILNEDGTIREWIGTCTDIDDRKQAEIDLKLSEVRYRSLVMAMSQIPWNTDAEGRCRDMPEWRAFTGQTVEEVINLGWLDALHPEDREKTAQVWVQAVQTKTLYETEYRIRAAHGSYRYFVARGVPILNEDGTIREWIGTCTDIDDRKLAEQKVRQTLDLLDLATDAIIIRDMSDRITYWNQGAECLYGWSRQEVIGQDIHSFLQTTFPKPFEEIQAEFAEQGTWEGELEHITRDGRQIIVASRWTLQRDQTGQPQAHLEINNDITSQKLGVIALAQAKDAAEAASRAKSEFLANMSHELRTPLNGILGYAQVLQRSKKIQGEERSRIDVIYQCGSHLLTLINDILDLSKIEAEKVELFLTDFHFPAFLQGVAEMCRVRAELKDIQFHAQFASELPVGIRADEKRLRQVLINLLSNGIKFTDSGSVTFTIAYASEGKIRFEVRDTGIGIAPEQIPAIFQPFEQVGDTRRQTEGTGLGLAISQRIVELMGSQIQVQSEIGVGSIFWFDVDLPTATEWVKTAQTDRYGQIIGIKGRCPKVLIIDDKWENRSVVNNLLSPIGFDVFEAMNGEEGWQKICEIQPDLVITDLLMPKLDGFELLKRVRSSELFQELIVIVSSASVFEADQYRSLDAGGNAFLPKPLQASELLEKVQQHLHLEWVYEEFESVSLLESETVEIVAPPSEVLEVFYNLAMKGNFKGILRQAKLLEEQNPQYASFAQQLSQMAKEFADEKIITLVQSYQSL